jgi:hypothetical protein
MCEILVGEGATAKPLHTEKDGFEKLSLGHCTGVMFSYRYYYAFEMALKGRELKPRISFSHVSPNTSNALITSKSPRRGVSALLLLSSISFRFGDFERRQEYQLTLLSFMSC